MQVVMKLIELVRESLSKKERDAKLFLDFSKAVGMVEHAILLDKLNYYGIRGVANDLIIFYLSNRTEFAKLIETDQLQRISRLVYRRVQY